MRKGHSIKLQTARIYLIIQQAAGFTQHAPLSSSISSCPHAETYLRRSSGFGMLAPWKAQGMTIRTARLPRAGNLLGRAGEDLSGLPDPASRYHFFYFFYRQYHISIQAPDFESLWQFLFCGSTIATSVSFHIIKLTDFSVVACDWLARAVKPIRS